MKLLAITMATVASGFHVTPAHRALPALSRTVAPRGSLIAPSETFTMLEDEGVNRCNEQGFKLLAKAVAAGTFVGIGGTLCATVGGDMGGAAFWEAGQGIKRFAFGAVGFPLSIICVAATGASAFTGNLVFAGSALRAKKTTVKKIARMLAITYIGSFIGAAGSGLLSAVAAIPAAAACGPISAHKLMLTPVQTLVRGVGAGWLITLAVTLATLVRGGGGNFGDLALSVWLPISTYVICDFEHCLANMYFFAAAMASGTKLATGAVLKNLLFSTVGNLIGGLVVTGMLLTWANGPDPIFKPAAA